MKKIVLILILLVLTIAAIFSWMLIAPIKNIHEKGKYFTIVHTNKQSVLNTLIEEKIISNKQPFLLTANFFDVWKKIKPGKYQINKGDNLIDVIRNFKNGKQAEVKLVINKLRIKEDFAKLVAKNFATDSASVMNFITSNDSLKTYGVDTNTVFTLFIPNTYAFYWNTSINNIFNKLNDTKNKFWQKNNRLEKATALHLTTEEVYTLASIIEEETNHDNDRAKIASVYLNRLQKNMALQACPTIKYAMKDFALTRIYEKYLFNPSPYNTYRIKGLPPGPICTPSAKCIDIVLNAPKTDYLFFVANANFDGYHHFSSNYAEHNKYAKAYQKALDEYTARKKSE